MAQIRVDGANYLLPDERVEQTKAELKSIAPGSFLVVTLYDKDGDEIWLKIPHDAPVAILAWDPYDPSIEIDALTARAAETQASLTRGFERMSQSIAQGRGGS